MIKKLNQCNYDSWFRALTNDKKEELFNYVKFGAYCGKHKEGLVWYGTDSGGGGYDILTCEKPINKDACFSYLREELKCPHKGCHTRIILTYQRDEIKEE